MPTITIRNLDEETKRELQALASMHDRSMEAEVRQILREYISHTRRHAVVPLPVVPGLAPPPAPDQELPFAADREPALALDREDSPAPHPEQPPEDDSDPYYALRFDDPLVPGHKVGRMLTDEEIVSVVNRQLEKMGFPEYAIPVTPPAK